jgi:hypothetical protein
MHTQSQHAYSPDYTESALSCTHLAAFLRHFDNYHNSNLLPASLTHILKLYNNPLKPKGVEDNAVFAKSCLGAVALSLPFPPSPQRDYT